MSCKVLHVSEAFGGGIVSSLHSFAQSTPEIEHHLLVCERKDEPLSTDLSVNFVSISPLRHGAFGAIMDIRRKIREIKPDFVHLHSSFAGVYGRIAGIDPSQLVYSPHGFAFHRRSANGILRGIYFLIERMLSGRSSNFAGVSLDEVKYARQMNSAVRSVFVPNTTDLICNPVRPINEDRLIDVVCMGRLCPQKDPAFLIDTLKLLPPNVRQRLSVTWIGGGDEKIKYALSAAGVNVTGWVKHSEASERLAACDLYFHVAAWEGFPMTVIEAAALGRPIIVRQIPAFEGFDFPDAALVESAESAAEQLISWVEEPDGRAGSNAMAQKVRDICSRSRQRAALIELYQAKSTKD